MSRRPMPPGGLRPDQHGANGYMNYACRCQVCNQANAAYMRDWRRMESNRRLVALTALRAIAESEPAAGSWDGWREVRRLRDIAAAALAEFEP